MKPCLIYLQYIAETLAAELSSADSNSLIHQYEYLIVPVVNPDGYKVRPINVIPRGQNATGVFSECGMMHYAFVVHYEFRGAGLFQWRANVTGVRPALAQEQITRSEN